MSTALSWSVSETISPLLRQFAFGAAVTGELSADCREGVLSLRLEKAERLRPKEITMTSS